jgi:RND family efflux transporter MFP subunit
MSDLSRDLASLRIDRSTPPPRRGVPSWLYGVAAVAVLVGVVAFAAPSLSAKFFKTGVEVTEILLVSPAQASVDLTSTGYVLPQTVAKVGSKVVGRVKAVHVKEGAKVKAGDLLFELDPTDQKSALSAAQAKVSAASARATAAKARAQAARSNVAEVEAQLARQKKLLEGGAVAQSTVDDIALRLGGLQAQVGVAEADAKTALADAAAAQIDVSVFQGNLEAMTVVAPIDGTAITKPAAVGDVVNPGQALVELADFSTLLVETDVPEARLGIVKVGAPCEVVLDAAADKRLRGEVAEIGPKLNRSKATGTVKVRILDRDTTVLPEMAARVSFLQKALAEADLKEPPKKIVPQTALVDREGRKHVFVLDGGKVRLVPVTLGAPFAGGFELREGPAPGTRVVANPPPTLVDGQAVKEGNA